MGNYFLNEIKKALDDSRANKKYSVDDRTRTDIG